MKKAIQLFPIIVCLLIQTNLFAQNFWVPDANFRNALKQQYSACFTAQDSLIIICAKNSTNSNFMSLSSNITNLSGIQFFDNLQSLVVDYNNIGHVDSLPPFLIQFSCSSNPNISLGAPFPNSLFSLYCNGCPNLNLSSLPSNLSILDCSSCNLTHLPPLPASIHSLSFGSNLITKVDSLLNTIEYLTINNSSIDTIVYFPDSLKYISLYGNPNLKSLPPLPSGITEIYVSDCALTSLPALPIGLTSLACDGNSLSSLPPIGPNIQTLQCNNNALTSLPSLGPNIQTLYCNNNALTSLPSLGPNIEWLYCQNNLISALPSLGPKLRYLNCSHNLLSTLPLLNSNYAFDLDCSYNSLIALPSFINTTNLFSINCKHNFISSIQNLPPSLTDLNCEFNPLSCLPVLPSSMFSLSIDSTYISCVPNIPQHCHLNTANPNNPAGNLPPICNAQFAACEKDLTHGFVFIDTNGNGVMDLGENGFSLPVAASNGVITQSDLSGFFVLVSDSGNTSFQIQVPQYFTNTTPLSQTINVLHNQIDTLYFGIQPIPNINDLKVQVNNVTFLRPGFGAHYSIHYQNIGTSTISNATVKFLKPSQLTNLSSVPPVSSTSGDTLIWNIASISPFLNPFTIDVWDSVAVTAVLGSFADAQAWIEPIAGDTSPANNYALNSNIIRGSFDPNDKAVSPQFIDENFSDYLDYKIRFQNTGTDTAFNVLVTDTLSPLLDWSSIQAIAASGNYQFDLQNGVAKWYFNHILLPDSNVNEVASHGFIEFRIKPVSTVLAGNQIQNKANIYFDFNSPVITNIAVVDVTPLGVKKQSFTKSHSYPNPVQTSIYLKSNENKALGKVELLDASGKLITTKTIPTKSFEWNVEALPNGIYILKGEDWIEKFVKK